jgi:hypothetical protein
VRFTAWLQNRVKRWTPDVQALLRATTNTVARLSKADIRVDQR